MKKRTHTYKFTIYFDRNANCECETEEISYEELTKMLNMPVKQALNKFGFSFSFIKFSLFLIP